METLSFMCSYTMDLQWVLAHSRITRNKSSYTCKTLNWSFVNGAWVTVHKGMNAKKNNVLL